MLTSESVKIKTLGPATIDSPLNLSMVYGDGMVNFVPDDACVPCKLPNAPGMEADDDAEFELAGPRAKLLFDPKQITAAVITCGGLCPGLNNVIRSLYNELHYRYGVKDIYGIRHGYRGLDPASGMEPVRLTSSFVENIHNDGGTILGSSRGPVDMHIALQTIRRLKINMLFTIGGDGTQTGAAELAAQAESEGYPLAVVGIPKTIDNDIQFVSRTFGYSTAIEKSREIIQCAHVEAKGAVNGVAVVKLMGRDAGFIAAGATISSQEVNFTLVPEVPFKLEGENGLLNLLKQRLLKRHHAVIVIAEGAGQNLADGPERYDASGNLLNDDVGPLLCKIIKQYMADNKIQSSVKYIDPSYIIRSIPASGDDSILCDQFARHAAHAAMAGKTDMLIGLWFGHFVHVPIPLSTSGQKTMNPEGELWREVLSATGQPAKIGPTCVGAN